MANEQSMTIYCRRCRTELRGAAPGSLVRCVCGLFTRAIPMHAEQPQTPIPARVIVVSPWWRVLDRRAS